eukprot:13005454-Alexandrium_andersonii.AAC.1
MWGIWPRVLSCHASTIQTHPTQSIAKRGSGHARDALILAGSALVLRRWWRACPVVFSALVVSRTCLLYTSPSPRD